MSIHIKNEEGETPCSGREEALALRTDASSSPLRPPGCLQLTSEAEYAEAGRAKRLLADVDVAQCVPFRGPAVLMQSVASATCPIPGAAMPDEIENLVENAYTANVPPQYLVHFFRCYNVSVYRPTPTAIASLAHFLAEQPSELVERYQACAMALYLQEVRYTAFGGRERGGRVGLATFLEEEDGRAGSAALSNNTDPATSSSSSSSSNTSSVPNAVALRGLFQSLRRGILRKVQDIASAGRTTTGRTVEGSGAYALHVENCFHRIVWEGVPSCSTAGDNISSGGASASKVAVQLGELGGGSLYEATATLRNRGDEEVHWEILFAYLPNGGEQDAPLCFDALPLLSRGEKLPPSPDVETYRVLGIASKWDPNTANNKLKPNASLELSLILLMHSEWAASYFTRHASFHVVVGVSCTIPSVGVPVRVFVSLQLVVRDAMSHFVRSPAFHGVYVPYSLARAVHPEYTLRQKLKRLCEWVATRYEDIWTTECSTVVHGLATCAAVMLREHERPRKAHEYIVELLFLKGYLTPKEIGIVWAIASVLSEAPSILEQRIFCVDVMVSMFTAHDGVHPSQFVTATHQEQPVGTPHSSASPSPSHREHPVESTIGKASFMANGLTTEGIQVVQNASAVLYFLTSALARAKTP